ncbi:MAG: hypothetical protein WA117_03280 [Verrucomicrobiia bacterium]
MNGYKSVVMSAVWTSLVACTLPQARSGDYTFRIRLPQSVDTTGLSIEYVMTGPFGGVGKWVKTKPNVREYEIDASHEGKPAETLKSIVYCPGYGIALIQAPSLVNRAARNATVELKPLPSVRLQGKVVMPEGRGKADFEIVVWYLAPWSHRFFGIADGAVTQLLVASGDVEPDGSFTMLVPDFSRDPVVNSFREREKQTRAAREPRTGNSYSETGSLTFTARERKTGNRPYELEKAESPGKWVEFGIDEKLPDRLILYAKPRKR